MSNIVFCWELGGGFGHLLQFRALASALAKAGHHVHICSRDLASAADIFGREDRIALWQAPHTIRLPRNQIASPLLFAHILHNTGWDSAEHLGALCMAWRNVFQAVRPDLVVVDHSPSALFVARALGIKRIVLGSGFCVPPDVCPLRLPRPASGVEASRLQADEDSLVTRCNELLKDWSAPALDRLGQLFSDVDETFLMTFPELDHYAGRVSDSYRGPVNGEGGAPPHWPSSAGPRVYAYLKNFPELSLVLQALRELMLPTVVYCPDVPADLKKKHASTTLHIETHRLDASRCAADCDIAITHAGHGITSTLLMAGRPMLCLPLVMEQDMMATNVQDRGLGIRLGPKDRHAVKATLLQLLDSNECRERVRGVAAKWSRWDLAAHQEAMLNSACRILK